MALLSSVEIISNNYTVDRKGIQKTDRQWLITTNIGDGYDVAITGVPVSKYDFHPELYALQAESITVEPVQGSNYVWKGKVAYSSQPYTEQGNKSSPPSQGDNSIRPDLRPYIISMTDTKVDKILTNDFSATPVPVVSSNGVPFVPAITVKSSHTLISIKGYRQLTDVIPQAKKNLYDDTVNSDDWALQDSSTTTRVTYPAYSLLVNSYTFTDYPWKNPASAGSETYFYEFNLTLEYNRDLWHPLSVANTGTMLRVPGGQPVAIVIRGIPVKTPLPLTADGTQILPDGTGVNYLSFTAYKLIAFTGGIIK